MRDALAILRHVAIGTLAAAAMVALVLVVLFVLVSPLWVSWLVAGLLGASGAGRVAATIGVAVIGTLWVMS